MTKLTDLEITMLKDINKSYKEYGVENTEFWNLYGHAINNNCEESKPLRKQLRGTFTSLKRKKIVSHYNDKDCFNPIFPTKLFIEIMNELNEEVDEDTKQYAEY